VPPVTAVVIQAAVEGLLDQAVAQRLIEEAGATPGPIYGRHGKGHLQTKIRGYNSAARFAPWLVLVDLDCDKCAPALRTSWLANESPLMCFRVAVREVEAWLLADRLNLARFLRVRLSMIPTNPEGLQNPKGAMVALANASRKKDIQKDMVPRPGSRRTEGPAYTSRLTEFVMDSDSGWDPNAAAALSPSLAGCLVRLRELQAAIAA
jgi:hypothetical protein